MSDPLWNLVAPAEREIVEQFTNATPVQVGALASALGLKVVRAPLAPKISGLIRPTTDSSSGFEIKVNKYEIRERQRFTVAHEIGHYLLHRASIGSGVVDNTLYRSVLTSRKEAEANRMAAEIVMPMALVKLRVAQLDGPVNDSLAESLAAEFEVSLPAMKIRLGLEV